MLKTRLKDWIEKEEGIVFYLDIYRPRFRLVGTSPPLLGILTPRNIDLFRTNMHTANDILNLDTRTQAQSFLVVQIALTCYK